ncbi:MAG: flagellar motor switch protein FliM [Planctomycetes bacterium]|nr:flagellar motor switch protein FliM [Planctomycetota bacterium]
MQTNSKEEINQQNPSASGGHRNVMGGAILTNEEVDALLLAIHEGQVLLGQTKGPKQHWKLQHYDFRRPERFPKEERRKLQKIHENASKIIGHSLSKYLRSSIDIHLISIEELTYDVFVDSCADIGYVNVLNLQPMTGTGCLILDLNLCFAIVDKGLGGPGGILHKVRPLTNVETAIIDVVITNILNDIKLAWKDVFAIDWKVQRKEFEPKAVQIVQPSEIVLSIKFASSGDLGFGGITLCLPFQALKPLVMGVESGKISRQEEVALIKNTIEKVGLEMTAILGNAEVSIHDLLDLKPGSVVVLDNKVFDEIELKIDGKTKLYGRPGLFGKKKAVGIVC